jgi:hypothetical protein
MPQTPPRVTRRQAVEVLNEHGFPTSYSTLAKITSPSQLEEGLGPPPVAYFGKHPLFDVQQLLAWAEQKLTPTAGRIAIADKRPDKPPKAERTKRTKPRSSKKAVRS